MLILICEASQIFVWRNNVFIFFQKSDIIIRLCWRESKVTRITCDCFSTSKQDRDDNDAVIIAAASNGSQTKCLLGEPSTTTLTNYTLSLEMKVINRD